MMAGSSSVASDRAAGGMFCLPGVTSHDVVSAGGAQYRIDIFIPDGPPPASGWPALLLLDAAGCFATTVEALRRIARRPDATGVHPMVVVGVSYPGRGHDVAQRRRDYTSPRPDQDGTGGAAAFLEFLHIELKPWLARLAHVDPARWAIFGHSLGGYFTLWVLANRPAVFRNYAAISPSIWWDREGLQARLADISADRRLLICIGEWEDALPPWQQALPGSADVLARRQSRQMVATARDLANSLSQRLADIDFRLLPEEDHASIISAAVPRALRLASRP